MNIASVGRRSWIAVLAAAALAACSNTPQRSDDRTSQDWPTFAAPASSEAVYRIDESESLLLARVDPEGPMARLGHSHVVGGSVLSGRLVTGGEAPRAEVRVRAQAFSVDRPEWRRAHGLEAELAASAIEGTRRNLLGADVLDAEAHPTIDVRSVSLSGPAWLPQVTLAVRWRGRVQTYELPVVVDHDRSSIVATGRLDLHHSDFGFEPFSAAGGALRVSDRIEIRFRIVAVRDVAIIAR